MTMKVEYLGSNPDGSPKLHYNAGPKGHVVITGPITGHVVTDDGERYDVTAPVIEVKSVEHAHEVAHLIGKRYAAEGHPAHLADPTAPPFEYTGKLITADGTTKRKA